MPGVTRYVVDGEPLRDGADGCVVIAPPPSSVSVRLV